MQKLHVYKIISKKKTSHSNTKVLLLPIDIYTKKSKSKKELGISFELCSTTVFLWNKIHLLSLKKQSDMKTLERRL